MTMILTVMPIIVMQVVQKFGFLHSTCALILLRLLLWLKWSKSLDKELSHTFCLRRIIRPRNRRHPAVINGLTHFFPASDEVDADGGDDDDGVDGNRLNVFSFIC